jgi:hypothetical protein
MMLIRLGAKIMKLLLSTALLSLTMLPAAADMGHLPAIDQPGAVLSSADPTKVASFDVLAAHAHAEGATVSFHMTTAGAAGADVPAPVGALAGAPVWSYVWPTTLDPATVGFEGGTGILAMAATNHPDFDDTPLYDENGDGDPANDGDLWHSHWVVLTPTEACGPGALAVRDIPQGETPKMPATWPGLPIFIDSPDVKPLLDGPEISVTIAMPEGTDLSAVSYDGVTSALRVNTSVHAPLLCITDVFDVASGDLSLPGKIEPN